MNGGRKLQIETGMRTSPRDHRRGWDRGSQTREVDIEDAAEKTLGENQESKKPQVDKGMHSNKGKKGARCKTEWNTKAM